MAPHKKPDEPDESEAEIELVENRDYYLDENGLFVFTEFYHLKRGYCCGNGCRHCPYDRPRAARRCLALRGLVTASGRAPIATPSSKNLS